MAIRYDPETLLRQIAPKTKLRKLLTKKLSVRKAALAFAKDIEFLSPKAIERVILKTIKEYKKRIKLEPSQKEKILKDPKLLIQRVQNSVIYEIQEEIKDKYRGEFFRWLPSDADEPDPQHQLRYGKTYQIGKDELPGERYGCRCGMQILVDEETLDID